MINSYKLGGQRFSKGAVNCILTIGILNLIMGGIFVVLGCVLKECYYDYWGYRCYRLYGFIIGGAYYIVIAIVLIIMSVKAKKNPVPLTQQSALYNVNSPQTGQVYNGVQGNYPQTGQVYSGVQANYPQTGQVYNGVQANQASVSTYSTNGGAPQGGIVIVT